MGIIRGGRNRRGSVSGGSSGGGGSPLTPGTASATAGDSQVSLMATTPSGGTAPYTYQWYRSTASGTKGSAIGGATSLSYTDTGLTNGTAYYYTLTATDSAAASVDYTQKSATPGSYATPNLVNTDFSSAALGDMPFNGGSAYGGLLNDVSMELGETQSYISVVTDATHGRALEMHFQAPGGRSNVSTRFNYSTGLGLGQELWFRGYLNLGALAGEETNNRKLLYWQPVAMDGSFYSVLHYWNSLGDNVAPLKITSFSPTQPEFTSSAYGPMYANTWYCIELYVKMNTTLATADGIVRAWVDGVVACEQTNVQWLQSSGAKMGTLLVGDQVSGSSYDERRRWAKIAFSTAGRIGP